jgi:hypothetical protein
MSFFNIGFAENADDTAAIEVSADRGQVFFRDNCEISSLDIANSTLRVWDTLVVKNTVTFGEGVTFDWGKKESSWQLVDGKMVKVETYTPATLVLEIDSIYELMERPDALMTLAGDADTMLNVADGVDMSNAKVELLFTENALAELSAIEGPVTLNLNKVTNLENIELSLAVEESLGKSAEEVFGTTSVTTGAVGSAENQFTITVPEPTTATLSLLALAGLCVRRRRK